MGPPEAVVATSGIDDYEVLWNERTARAAAVEAERAAWRSYLHAQRDTLRGDRRSGPGVDLGATERRADVVARRAYDGWQAAHKRAGERP